MRDRDERRKAEERDRDERRESELETERWERLDRRVERYVFLAISLLSAVAAIALAFIALPSDQVEVRISPSVPVVVSILAGLRLRALSGPGVATRLAAPRRSAPSRAPLGRRRRRGR